MSQVTSNQQYKQTFRSQKMEFISNNLKRTVGVYRCPDEINNLKIRIKIGELHKRNGKNPDKWIEKEFSWQEKRFSIAQKAFFGDERNCFTEHEKKYHKMICDFKKLQVDDTDDRLLFSYINEEEFLPENETSSVKINYLENAMNNLEIGHPTAENEYNFVTSLRTAVENPICKSDAENMFLMADFGANFEDMWIKNEKVLCAIKFNSESKVLSVFPDFTTSHPYTLKIENEDDERVFTYFIENSSKNIPESIEVNEKTLIKKINDYKTSLKSHVLTDTFKLPPKNKLLVFIFLEISSGKNFEYPDVYVQYFIDLPDRWSAANPESLSGRTQICKAVKKDGLVHFGHCVEVSLEYTFLPLLATELPKSPYIYFEVISKDSWDRHRTEGLCYKCLPISFSGYFKYLLNCVRFTTKNPINEMRRFFIGDCQNYDDVTWIGIPKDHEGIILNKFGTETTSTGQLNIILSVVHQSQSLVGGEDVDNSKNRHERMIFERLGSSSLLKSVEEVIREFKKARKEMLEARRK